MNCSEELKRRIAEQNTTLEAVAHTLGVNRSTLYRKLRGGGKKLTISDVSKISQILN
ncbi:MAG: helix-turn-helix domain-containing protein, partial [Clostridiales bacterium]|nr:helix-turn-helix domain-containing protein [Clostridiales bacterium]